MNRTPPTGVRQQLRREVGYGCPVAGCGNPYLGYHHFDPPWAVKEHHDPSGMIALCGEHHPKADTGAFTDDQLRELKTRKADQVGGSFDWRRKQVLAIVGGNLYFEVPQMVVFREEAIIWFDRDDEGALLLNLRMLSTSREPRLVLSKNDWLLFGSPSDFESPPSGKRIRATYPNGDALDIHFMDLEDPAHAGKRYTGYDPQTWTEIPFPLTAVELQMIVGGTDIAFGPDFTQVGGNFMTGSLFKNCGIGLSFT